MTQPVNMVHLLTVRQTHNSFNCVQTCWSEQELCLKQLLLFSSLVNTEIPYCVARPSGTEEWHGCSPVAFCLWKQSSGSQVAASAGRRCSTSDCPENETRSFATGERSQKNYCMSFDLVYKVCFFFCSIRFSLSIFFFYRGTVIIVFSLLCLVDEIKMML